MNYNDARKIFDSYDNPEMSSSDWFFANDDELRSHWGVPENVIQAGNILASHPSPEEIAEEKKVRQT